MECVRVSAAKREGKRPPGKPRRRWENNIKTEHKSMMRVRGWTCLAEDREM